MNASGAIAAMGPRRLEPKGWSIERFARFFAVPSPDDDPDLQRASAQARGHRLTGRSLAWKYPRAISPPTGLRATVRSGASPRASSLR